MSDFTDMIAHDNQLIFLNLNEFGEEHLIENRRITIVVDNDTLKERQGGAELNIAESSMMFFALERDLPTPKAPGTTLFVDHRPYIVDDWQVSGGIVQVAVHHERLI